MLTIDNEKLLGKAMVYKFTSKKEGTVKWQSTSTSSLLKMKVTASAEFDGFVSYSIKINCIKRCVTFKYKSRSFHIIQMQQNI